MANPNQYVPNPNHDIYNGNLLMLKRRVTAWGDGHPRARILRVLIIIGLILGLGLMILPTILWPGNEQILWAFIAVVLGYLYALGKYNNALTRAPFEKLHNARFEASDKGLYYIYQYGMKLFTYYIEDSNIQSIIVDRSFWVMKLIGTANIEVTTRRGTEPYGQVDTQYLMIPFDGYDLDDLLAPYGDLVKESQGTLRLDFLDSIQKQG